MHAGAIRQVEAELGGSARHHLRSHEFVRAAVAFADVMVEPHQEQQIGPRYGRASFSAPSDGKDGVIVHGMSVRALPRQHSADVLPLRNDSLPQTMGVHLLDKARGIER